MYNKSCYILVLIASSQWYQVHSSLLSGATLFVGGKSPIVTTSYAQFQGKDDDITGTSNYLGIPYASAPRFDHSVIADQPVSGILGRPPYFFVYDVY